MGRQYLIDEEHLLTLLSIAEWELRVMPRSDSSFYNLHLATVQAINAVTTIMGAASHESIKSFYLSRQRAHRGGELPGELPTREEMP